MNEDALERLKKRQRPTVPIRDVSLISGNEDTSTSRYLELEQPQVETDTLIPKDLEAKRTQIAQDISISRNLEAKQPKYQGESIQTKQSTLRLEAELSDRLQAVCRDNSISREVLLEALFQYYESTPALHQEILSEAKRRGELRQQVANFRRAQSMMERFGEQRGQD